MKIFTLSCPSVVASTATCLALALATISSAARATASTGVSCEVTGPRVLARQAAARDPGRAASLALRRPRPATPLPRPCLCPAAAHAASTAPLHLLLQQQGGGGRREGGIEEELRRAWGRDRGVALVIVRGGEI